MQIVFYMQNTVVSLQNVSITNENKVVLSHVNFEVGKGEFVFFDRKNGSWKKQLIKSPLW